MTGIRSNKFQVALEAGSLDCNIAPAILFVTYGWKESGGGTLLPRKMAYELVKRGYRVSVLYASLDEDVSLPPYSITSNIDAGVYLYGIINRPAHFSDPDNPQREIDDPNIRQIFCSVLDEVQPSLVHFHNFHGLTFSIAEETYRRNIPSCLTTHNHYLIDPELSMVKFGLIRWSGVDMMIESDVVARNPHLKSMYCKRMETARNLLNVWINVTLAVSERQRDLLVRFGADEKRIAMIHQISPLADRLWIDPAYNSHRPIKRPLQVGYLGAIIPVKGVQMIVAAAQAFAPDELHVHLYGFGPKLFEDDLRAQDQKGMVTFHGSYDPDRIGELAHHIDVAVISSIWEEPAPTLVLTELQAMRIPVIGANVGGIPELITDGIDGVLYPPEDLDALIRHLKNFVEKPELLAAMRQNLDAPTHTFARYMERLEQLYREMMTGEEINADRISLIAPKREAAPAKCSAGPHIYWHGGLFVHHSLAHVNRELALQLLDQGYQLSFFPTQPDEFSSTASPRFNKLEACRNRSFNLIDVTVRHQWPPDFSRTVQGKLVVIQPWEFGSVPVEWVRQINANVDELWVPSCFVRDCYVQSGVAATKVQVVPNGVATDCFNPAVLPCNLATQKRFRFLFVGGTIQRKGIDILLAAYSEAFTSDDDVCLVIKDMGGSTIYQGQTAGEMIADFKRVATHPEIVYLEEMLDNDRMASLYTCCHCLVHPYRGEGFGLPIAEAMACGLAPIVTGYGAAVDFCPPEIAWLIPAPLQYFSVKKVGNLETVDFPWLAEPDVDSLATLMRHAFTHPDEVRQRGIAASRHIQEHFTWGDAARIAGKRLQFLARQNENGSITGTQSSNIPPQEFGKIEAKGSEVSVNNNLAQAACMKADKLAQMGDVDAAVQVLLNEGIRADADSPVPYLALVEILLAAERFEDALGVVSEMPSSTDNCLIHEIEAQCHSALGNDAEAREAARLAGEQRPMALVVLGTLSARHGDTAQGESLLRQAIALDSNCGKAWLSLAIILWSRGEMQESWESVRHAVEIEPLNDQAVTIFRDISKRLALR